MKKYTLGFIFNSDLSSVVLMQKARPDWQKGKLNGVGGKIEEGETAVACMARETEEEAGLATKPEAWIYVALLRGPDWAMDVFALVYDGAASDVKTLTDEPVAWYDVAALPEHALFNVPWLVQLSKDVIT